MVDFPLEDELDLIAQVIAGHWECYHELVRRHERAIYIAAYSFVTDENLAEHIAQKAVLRAFQTLSEKQSDISFRVFLILMAHQISDEAVVQLPQLLDRKLRHIEVPKNFASSTFSTKLQPSSNLALHLLRQELLNLPPLHRQIFVLCKTLKLTIHEVSICLQENPSEVERCLAESDRIVHRGLFRRCLSNFSRGRCSK